MSLPELIASVRDRLRTDSAVLQRFEGLLSAAGFRDEDDYPERWRMSERAVYRVGEDFPRLVPSNVPSGVGSVRYVLTLAACGGSLVSAAQLSETLGGSA